MRYWPGTAHTFSQRIPYSWDIFAYRGERAETCNNNSFQFHGVERASLSAMPTAPTKAGANKLGFTSVRSQ